MSQLQAVQESLFKRIIMETMQYDFMKQGVTIGFYTNMEVLKQHAKLKAMVKQWEKLEYKLRGAN